MAADELGVPGDHNIENALAAIAVGKLCDMPNEAIKRYKPLQACPIDSVCHHHQSGEIFQ